MALFDRYLIVDWSAANAPKTGKDSIWIALADGTELAWVRNVPTRFEAMALVRQVIDDTLRIGKRLFAGFDFAFGYPTGASKRIAGGESWEAVWQKFSVLIEDDEQNQTNTYAIAGLLNQTAFDGLPDGPFWGHPHQHAGRYPGLGPTKPRSGFGMVSEFRLAERANKGAKSLWQMAGAGVVAAQTMTGIKHLQALRTDDRYSSHISIWPFETQFDKSFERQITIGEIYPSVFDVIASDEEVKDQAQVRALALGFAEADAENLFRECLSAPELASSQIVTILREEGWIVRAPRQKTRGYDYIRDPQMIYDASFDIVRREANLSSLPKEMRDVAIRLIHSCGMIDIVDDLAFSSNAFAVGQAALAQGAAIICDVEMVRHGIIQRNLKGGNELFCAVADDATRQLASAINNTRSAAAMDVLRDKLDGAIVVIGNAPTALFRVLELVREGAAKPALIIGMPVGFVGAAESKQALIDQGEIPYITITGRRGGSAMASATLNALAAGLKGGL